MTHFEIQIPTQGDKKDEDGQGWRAHSIGRESWLGSSGKEVKGARFTYLRTAIVATGHGSNTSRATRGGKKVPGRASKRYRYMSDR